ncbi:MAG: hypothetical protein Ct9H90mP30_4080 [Actinomycetota bacterium]|nr:MAG: hypothetical protein Ct9H90mP30_4080 [Actinomycetota bacterium]
MGSSRPNIMPPASKTTGNYANSTLAKMEALNAGYDEAIMLNKEGLVAECSGENLFVCRNGKIMTPPLVSGALEGITQHTVMSFVRDLGHEVPLRLSHDQTYTLLMKYSLSEQQQKLALSTA